MSDRARKPSNYLPTLDGWRAVSIALVILHHARVSCSWPVIGPLLRALGEAGEVGVEVFFAISGLLICSRLLDEESRTGKISIRRFYLRRSFRILPAALLYLSVVALLGVLHFIPLTPGDWLAALLFFRNYAMLFAYLHHSPLALHWYTGHFWSLSMEEHFYLFLPGVLVFFKKTRLWVLGGLAVLVALWRFVLAHILQQNYQLNFRSDTHLDALLIPAMIALLLFPLPGNEAARRLLPAWAFPLIFALEIALLSTRIPFAYTAQPIVLSLLILSTIGHPGAFPGRLLEWAPLRWIGCISYSLYLWQQLFFGVNLVGSPPRIAFLRTAPLSFILLLACATFSYYVVEKPCIRFGHNLAQGRAPRASRHPGHLDVAKRNENARPLTPKGRINTAS